MDDLSRFCCLNSRGPDLGRRDAGNLTVTGRLGKSRQFRLLSCRTCRDRFSEPKGTPLGSAAHLPEDKVTSILEHIHQGCGVLKTWVPCQGPSRDRQPLRPLPVIIAAPCTTSWWPTRPRPAKLLEMDENWSFVAKTEKNCDQGSPRPVPGGLLGPRGVRPGAPPGRVGGPGERTAESVPELVTDVKERRDGRLPERITTDESTADEGGRSWRRSARRWYRRGPASRGGRGRRSRWHRRSCMMPRCTRRGRRAEWWMW